MGETVQCGSGSAASPSEPVPSRCSARRVMARTEGRVRCDLAPLWLLLLWTCARAVGDLEVEMAESVQMVSLHENITIPCKIPGSPHLDIQTVGIIWYWRNQKTELWSKVFEFYGEHQDVFRSGASVTLGSLERGDASLQLPGVLLGEAGEYRCKLFVTPQMAEGMTRLEVVAHPVTTLFVEEAVVKTSEETHIVCKSYVFFPENISVKWETRTPRDPHFQSIPEGFVTDHPVRNEDGTFNVTSRLHVKLPLEDNGAIFQCVVSHRSLHTSRRFNITLPTSAGCVKRNYMWDFWSCSLVILFIVMASVLSRRYQ